MWHLLLLVAASWGWQLFPDGPLANYIMTGLLVAYLCGRLAWNSPLWPAYGYGGLVGLLTAGCGGLYAAEADSYHVLCDKGTGLPISIITAGLALASAALLIRSKP